jgi:all-trans-retinol dehydrogenase (NAD+)
MMEQIHICSCTLLYI